MNPLSLSIIVATFPREQLAAAIGIWAGISGLGLAVGPLLGGFLVEHVGWSTVFWINVPIGVVAAVVLLWGWPSRGTRGADTLDIVGTVLVTAGLFSLVFGLIETNSHSLDVAGDRSACSPPPSRCWSPSWCGSCARRSRCCRWGSSASRAFSVAALVVGLVGFALFGSIYFITLYFQNVQGYSALEAGVRTLPMTLMVIADRAHRRPAERPHRPAADDAGRHARWPRSPSSAWRRWTSTRPTTRSGRSSCCSARASR